MNLVIQYQESSFSQLSPYLKPHGVIFISYHLLLQAFPYKPDDMGGQLQLQYREHHILQMSDLEYQ